MAETKERQGPTEERTTVLQLKEITKTFPGVKALSGVSFDLREGEVHALLGENGAGKSTLMKVLAGNHSPDEGEIFHREEKVAFQGPMDAKKRGIILIHQELSLVPGVTVAENVFLGSLPTKAMKRVDWHQLKEDTEKILEELRCNFSSTDLVGDLSIAQQQMVEIARSFATEPDVLVFDEPTSSLTAQEQEVLFENIHRVKEQGVAIIYISHKMGEIFEISDRITVLRDGEKTGTLNTSETNEAEVTKLMIGRELDNYYEKSEGDFGEEILRVEGLGSKGAFNDVSLAIQECEVLGMYGLVGAGRSEVAETIFGMRKATSGKIFIGGEEQDINNSNTAMKLGIGLVPEDRKEQGLVLGMGVRDNMILPQLDKVQHLGFVNSGNENEIYNQYKDSLSISTPGPKQQAVNLSGGNQQKVVIAKWLSTHPTLLILDEPTRGIDVGSKAEIHHLIRSLAESGYAILVISSEMPEIMGVSHRILTMYEGQMTGEFDARTVTEDDLVNAITSPAA